jgi:hypothetical protein
MSHWGYERRGISSLSELLLSCDERICSTELVDLSRALISVYLKKTLIRVTLGFSSALRSKSIYTSLVQTEKSDTKSPSIVTNSDETITCSNNTSNNRPITYFMTRYI